jgi:D-apiose dehydrogenase
VLRGAVLGCGREGRLHLSAWRKVRTAKIEAVVDMAAPRVASAARDFYVPRHYADLDAMLSRERLDFVDIAVGVNGQDGLVRKCLSAGLHVLAASPLSANYDTARDLMNVAAGCKLTLMVGHRERWRAALRAVKRALDSGAVGAAHYLHLFDRRPLARSHPADPARPGLDSQQHLLVIEGLLDYVDFIRYTFGEIKSVWAATLKLNPAVKGEDFALVVLRTTAEKPVNVILDVNWSAPLPGSAKRPATGPEIRCEGAAGALELDPADGVLRRRGHTGAAGEDPLPAVPDLKLEPYLELQGHFAECLESGRTPDCSGPDALRSLEAALAIYESDRSGGLVLIQKP